MDTLNAPAKAKNKSTAVHEVVRLTPLQTLWLLSTALYTAGLKNWTYRLQCHVGVHSFSTYRRLERHRP